MFGFCNHRRGVAFGALIAVGVSLANALLEAGFGAALASLLGVR